LPDATIKALGDVPANQAANLNFTLQNLTGHLIRLQGSQTSCTCSVVAGLPYVIKPRGTGTISVIVATGSNPESLQGTFHLYTDDAVESDIRLGYSGRVVLPSTGEGR